MRPARAALTMLGTVLGVGALVATLGAAQTATQQIVARFDRLAATEVLIRTSGAASGSSSRSSILPLDADDRLSRLRGVVSAGDWSLLHGSGHVRRWPSWGAVTNKDVSLDLVATSPGLLVAAHATIGEGRSFDAGNSERGDDVVLLGSGAAARLGFGRIENGSVIFIDDRAVVVIGVISGTQRKPELLNEVIVSDGYAKRHFGLLAPDEILVDTVLGAARQVASQSPAALFPNAPGRLDALVPAEPTTTRAEVKADTRALFLALGLLLLIIGVLGIANVTLVAVTERVGEIGLRRALGASRLNIATQFLLESMFLGVLGGTIGANLGLVILVGLCALKGWAPVVDTSLPFLAAGAGSIAGLVAGVYPAWRAAKVEPVAALRGL